MTATLRVREVLPETSESADLATDAGRLWLAERYGRADVAVRVNMITSLSGGAVGPDGTSETLTSRVDRAILGGIRRAADVVVVGAETVRAEQLRRPRSAALAVLTRHGLRAADAASLAGPEGGALYVLCPEAIAGAQARDVASLGAQVVPLPADEDGIHPVAALDALAARGLVRVVCEGGPTLATRFVSAGVVDELCVTLAPVVGAEPPGGPFLRIAEGVAVPSRLDGMLVDDAGFSYLRLRA